MENKKQHTLVQQKRRAKWIKIECLHWRSLKFFIEDHWNFTFLCDKTWFWTNSWFLSWSYLFLFHMENKMVNTYFELKTTKKKKKSNFFDNLHFFCWPPSPFFLFVFPSHSVFIWGFCKQKFIFWFNTWCNNSRASYHYFKRVIKSTAKNNLKNDLLSHFYNTAIFSFLHPKTP